LRERWKKATIARSSPPAGFEDIEIEPTRIYRAQDAEPFLEEKGIDVGAFRDQIDGKFMSAFIRAKKPSPCC
jgi:hypothetical protein